MTLQSPSAEADAPVRLPRRKMKITKVEPISLYVPIEEKIDAPIAVPHASDLTDVIFSGYRTTLVRIETDDGLVGWGECMVRLAPTSTRAIIEEIADGALKAGGRPGETFYEVEDRAEAIALAVSLADAGDTILLAGKGHERSIILNGKKLPWDEAAVARRAIQTRIEQEREK